MTETKDLFKIGYRLKNNGHPEAGETIEEHARRIWELGAQAATPHVGASARKQAELARAREIQKVNLVVKAAQQHGWV